MTQSEFPLWKKIAGAGLFLVLLPIIVPTAIVSGVYYASCKVVRRARRRGGAGEELPQLVFFRKIPATWTCSKCGKEYVLPEHATPETIDSLLEEIERDFSKHVAEEHSMKR